MANSALLHTPPTQKWVPWWGTCWPFTTSISQPRYLHRSVPLEGKVISKCFHWKNFNWSTFQLIWLNTNTLSTSGHRWKEISSLANMLTWREAILTSLQEADEEKKKETLNTQCSRPIGYKLMLRTVCLPCGLTGPFLRQPPVLHDEAADEPEPEPAYTLPTLLCCLRSVCVSGLRGQDCLHHSPERPSTTLPTCTDVQPLQTTRNQFYPILR